MTLTQLEQYMVAEVDNLHLKIDSAIERIEQQFVEMRVYMDRQFSNIDRRFDRLGGIIENHSICIATLEHTTT